MSIPHTSILKSFTAVETTEVPNGQEISVYTLTRDSIRDGFWRMTRTSFKTFRDGFDAPKLRREVWNDATAADMIDRFKAAPNCRCDGEA